MGGGLFALGESLMGGASLSAARPSVKRIIERKMRMVAEVIPQAKMILCQEMVRTL